MARQAKKLVLEKGSPNPKPGKALPDRTQLLVLDAYSSGQNKVSVMCSFT